MEKSVLLSKKETYISVKKALIEKDYSSEIEAKVNEFRNSLTEQYARQRKQEIDKCDTYLTFIDECLLEISTQEENKVEHNSHDAVNDTL